MSVDISLSLEISFYKTQLATYFIQRFLCLIFLGKDLMLSTMQIAIIPSLVKLMSLHLLLHQALPKNISSEGRLAKSLSEFLCALLIWFLGGLFIFCLENLEDQLTVRRIISGHTEEMEKLIFSQNHGKEKFSNLTSVS